MTKKFLPSSFGRRQRNVPTEPDKTAYDPNFGKAKNIVPDLLEEQPPRTDLEELEKAARGQATIRQAPKGPPKPMRPADLEKELAKAKGGKPQKIPDLKKLPPGKTLPPGASGLAEYEKAKKSAKPAKTKVRPGKAGGLRAKTPSLLRNLGKIVSVGAIAGVIGFALLNYLGVAVFEHAAEKVLQKIGQETDLSDYLPGGARANKVVWSAASYRRYNADPFSELPLSNTAGEEITLYPPQNGILALGISLEGLPELFVSEINVNELGDGQSDWLCESYQGYLICRSLGGYPLNSKLETVVTLFFHLPAYEVKEMVAAGSGSRAVYFIVK